MNRENLESALRDIRSLVGLPGEDQIPDAELLQRYVDSREEAAFSALVRRYGPAVLRVCYRVLQRSHDAEDAFQATFLVLARESMSLRSRGAVGAWLYEVAYHVALRAREKRARQQHHEEQRVRLMENDDPAANALRKDVHSVLDEELHRLPEKYRRPLILCDLLSRTHEEAARELGLHRTSLTKRLKRAHHLLRQRMQGRGIGLSMVLLLSLLHEEAMASPVTPDLLLPVVRTALAVAYGRPAVAPAPVAALADRGFQTTSIGSCKLTHLLVATALLLVTGGTWALHAWVAPDAESALLVAPSSPPVAAERSFAPPTVATRIEPADSEANSEPILITGRILDPRGMAVPGARVAVCGRQYFRPGKRNIRDKVLARTRTDNAGCFRLTVRRPASAWSLRTRFVQLWTTAPGHAPATLVLPWRPETPPLEVNLLPPDVIRGRLVGSDGRPAAGVRVAVYQIGTVCREPIQGLDQEVLEGPALWPAPVTTGVDGSFALYGLNLQQGVHLCVCDDRYALRKAFLVPRLWSDRVGKLQLGPARTLEGKITAGDTGEALPSARLSVLVWDEAGRPLGSAIDARADASGTFHVRLPRGESYRVEAFAPDGMPYLGVHRSFLWPAGASRHEVQVALPRGCLIRGTVSDADNGAPMPGAHIQFLPLASETVVPPEVLTGLNALVTGEKDGSFRLVIPEVAGHLLVHEPSGDYITEEACTRPQRDDRAGERLYAQRVLTLAPAPGQDVRELHVVLRRGVRIPGWVVGLDGEPVSEGAWLCRGRTCPQEPAEGQPQPFWNGHFMLRGCVPGRVYPVLFLDAKHRLGAQAELVADPAREKPVEVKLQRCGEAQVRFVDPRGRPLAGHGPFLYAMVPPDRPVDEEEDGLEDPPAEMHELDEFDLCHYQNGPRTDADGRVTLPALIPGVRYRMNHYMNANGGWREFEAAAGQILSLPDVVIKRPREAESRAGR